MGVCTFLTNTLLLLGSNFHIEFTAHAGFNYEPIYVLILQCLLKFDYLEGLDFYDGTGLRSMIYPAWFVATSPKMISAWHV